MKTMRIQFHATTEDIREIILGVIGNNHYTVCGVKYFPEFTIENISGCVKTADIKMFRCLVISKNVIPFADDNYNFMKTQNNNLFIDIGKNDDGIIKESAISVFSETEIDSDWRKAINNCKRKMLKGAWVVNPHTNAKAYYKNHRYTVNAKIAYENGTQICPIAGWNFYELTNDQDMQ